MVKYHRPTRKCWCWHLAILVYSNVFFFFAKVYPFEFLLNLARFHPITPHLHSAKLNYLPTVAAADLATLCGICQGLGETAKNPCRYRPSQISSHFSVYTLK